MPARAFHILLMAALVLAALAADPFAVGSASAAEMSFADIALAPKVPKGKGDKCVADTDVMRREHMNMLNHQRDDTVHDGIRTKRFSLKGCLECHAVMGPDARPVTADSPQHFCRTCHDYAAVKIDCFECHASRPEAKKAASHNVPVDHHQMLTSYLKEVGK